MAYPALGLSTPRGSWGVSCVARASSSSVSRLRTKCRGGVIPIRIPKIPKSCLVTARCLSPSSNPNSPKREDPLNAFPSRRLEGSASKLPCAWCGDTGASECKTCGGDGVLSPGGFHLKNHVDVKCVVGTNWTAMLRTQGWRHFEATEVTVKNKKDVQVKLTATCDRSIDVWVSVSDLKNRNKWSAGWKQKEELLWTGDANSEYGAVAAPKSGKKCPKCLGDGAVPCARSGCAFGLARVLKTKQVIEKANDATRRALKDAQKKAQNGDQSAAAFAARAKATLRETAKAKKTKREKRSARKNDKGAPNNGEEDWGARARNARDDKLEAFVKGVDRPVDSTRQ